MSFLTLKEFIIHMWSSEGQKRALPYRIGSMQKDFHGQSEQTKSHWAEPGAKPCTQAALPLLLGEQWL